MRAGDARHEFHRQRGNASLCIIIDAATVAERAQNGGKHGAGLDPRQVGNRRALHTKHEIGRGNGGSAVGDRGAGFGIGGIGNRRTSPGTGFDGEFGAQADEFTDGFGRGCNAVFSIGSFAQHGDLHYMPPVFRLWR